MKEENEVNRMQYSLLNLLRRELDLTCSKCLVGFEEVKFFTYFDGFVWWGGEKVVSLQS